MLDSDSSASLRFGRFTIWPAERRLIVDGEAVEVGKRAFDLLLALAKKPDRALGKNELLELVWPGRVVEENNLQVQISTLRRVLGPETIATVPGRGYRFTAVPYGARPATSVPAPAVTRDRSAGNLPEPASAVYGRDEDLSGLLTLLGSRRLVTLVGAGGIGKSTLALAAARAERGRWEDGVWLVELAPVADSALVPASVAQALGIQLAGRCAPVDELADALHSRSLLLLLDNCEHLLPAVTQLVGKVLAVSHSAKILATSQEPLHMAAEQQFRVPPLAVPADARSANPHDYGALALFEARVQAIDRRFNLDKSNLSAAIEICRRLDCLPLAIELAAARVPLLGTEGVRVRLDDRFRILTTGLRTGLSRHQTLRAAIEWSHSLLTAEEQAVFRRLSVFCGSFGLDTAQQVASDTRIDEWAVLDHLGALVDKSLVAVQPGEVPRYRLLETARALAWEKLGAAGETSSIQRAHAQAVLAAFECAFRERWRKPSQYQLNIYVPDLDNLRAALEWANQSENEGDLLIAIAGASAWIWHPLGLRLEGMQRCAIAIGRIGATTSAAIEARLQLAYVILTVSPSPPAEQVGACERAVELYRLLGDRQELFVSLIWKARQRTSVRDFASAEHCLREAEEFSEPTWPPALRSYLLLHRATLSIHSHRWDEARVQIGQALQLARESGDPAVLVKALGMSIDAWLIMGDAVKAEVSGREMLDLLRRERPDCTLDASWSMAMLSAALTQRGHLDEALQMARDATQLMRDAGTLPFFLDHFAILALKRGRSADAARALGRTEDYFVGQGLSREINEQRARDELFTQLRQLLPEEDLVRYMREGAEMSDEDASRAALRE